MSGYRLDKGGLLIDRTKEIAFRFDGKTHQGHAGDTLASALLASGQTLFGRSFKYHRPRGLYSAGPEEPNALVELRPGSHQVPNTRATMVELHQGLEANSQNRFPSLGFDIMAVNDRFSRVLSAGFYYKTFMGTGQPVWHFFEHFIRRAAGLGKASHEADTDRYEKTNAFTDVLVVGAGPAGLMAAKAAAEAGKRVLLVDENAQAGGRLWDEGGEVEGMATHEWARAVIASLEARANVTILLRTSVYGYYDDNILGAAERVSDHKKTPDAHEPRHRHWTIHAKKVVLATGAIERPIAFSGNDAPGVMLASAGLAYAARYGVAAGRQVAIFANNDGGARAAIALSDLGVNVTALVDARASLGEGLTGALSARGVMVWTGSAVTGTRGRRALKSIDICGYDDDRGALVGAMETIACDALLVSGGWTPTVHLASQAGGPPVFDETLQAFLPGEPREDWIACGNVAGELDLASCITSGTRAGAEAAGAVLREEELPEVHGACGPDTPLPLWEVPAAGKGKVFVDLQNDVTAEDVRLAEREGFRSVEHLKRYTTLGMAADQGKTSNVNGLAILARARGQSIPDVGTTRFRPPYQPVPIGAIAGREAGAHLMPVRRTPMHDWHEAHGGEMMEAGLWMRPQIYRREGETLEQAYVREARNVRENVGIVDVSTLGKIDVQGPDAAKFLDLIYTNAIGKVKVGKARYGLMLREDGILFDDGTAWRLGEGHYLVTTTTAGAAAVLAHMEYYLSAVWPELKVHVASVSDQWAGTAVAGPKARTLLEAVVTGCDLSNDALPQMGIADGKIGEIDVKIARLSFSGELAYEVYSGWNEGLAVWNALYEAGLPFGLMPYGMEAMGTLRIEKGHVTHAEMDGRTTAADLGLGALAAKRKPYIGSAMQDRPALADPDREVMVGLVSKDGEPIPAGSHLVTDEGRSLGHVTAFAFSPVKETYIALALLKQGRERIGDTLEAAFPLKERSVTVDVVDPCFYDKDGSRLNV